LSLPLNKFRWEHDFNSELEDFFSMRKRDYAGGRVTRSWDAHFGVAEKDTGYYFECDVSFSDKCKMQLKDFPPLPSHNNVEFDDLSPFAQESYVNIHGKKECYREESKLMLTFGKKYSYVIHSTLADIYSLHGVEFSNIKRVLAFHQEPFLRGWIELNTEGRKRAARDKNETLRNFFKV
jgi:hypothetical protein